MPRVPRAQLDRVSARDCSQVLQARVPALRAVLLHLRAGRSCNAATPVIRFTAAAEARPVEIRKVGGVAEVTLPKPLRMETFVSTVKAMLGAL